MSESFEKAVEAGARRIWIERAVMEWSDQDWAESAWDDMGGSEPSIERAGVELQFRAALTDALPHLTDQDVPHVAREAWDGGYAQAQYTHCEAKWQPCDATDTNPYAEEADHE